MPFRQFVINESIESTDAFAVQRVAEGNYLLQITGVRPSKEDYDGEPAFCPDFTVLAGPDAVSQRFSQMHSVTTKDGADNAQGYGLGQLIKACGLNPGDLKGRGAATYPQFVALVAGVSKALSGLKVGAYVIDNAWGGTVRSKVSEYYSEAEYGRRKALIAAAPPQTTKLATSPSQGAPNGPVLIPPGTAAIANPEMDAAIDALFIT